MGANADPAVVRENVEECGNKGNLSAADHILHPDYVWHGPGADVEGIEASKQMLGAYRAAFPDLHFTIEEQVTRGDKVWTWWTVEGTHEGEFMGLPATHNQLRLSGVIISRFVDGKIAEEWDYFDQLSFMQQIEAIPDMATAEA